MDSRELDFIARRYRKGRFSPDRGWRRLGIAKSFRMRRMKVGAVIAATVLLSATAAIIYMERPADDVPALPVPAATVSHMAEVRVIDFEDAPLPEVVEKIEAVYGVEVGNLPDSPDGYTLSLHYEGTPADLIDRKSVV